VARALQAFARFAMRNPFEDLIEFASRGKLELFRATAARAAGELQAQKPVCPDDQPYGRAVLHQTPLGEVMLATWRKGARSAPHDHGKARGFVLMLEGRFCETVHEFDGTDLRATQEREVAAGDVLHAPAGLIHDLAAKTRGLSLHVYLPGIDAMRVYDRRARATLLVAGRCGAWIPREPELVLVRRNWPRGAAEVRTGR
jgi:quercetin dioxygenase-like cupin family protein